MASKRNLETHFDGWLHGKNPLHLEGEFEHRAFLRWARKLPPGIAYPLLKWMVAREEPHRVKAAIEMGMDLDSTWQQLVDEKNRRAALGRSDGALE